MIKGLSHGFWVPMNELDPDWDKRESERISKTRDTCHNVAAPPENGFWPTPHFECSACGKYYVTSDYVYFCPSCGRRVIEDVQQEP